MAFAEIIGHERVIEVFRRSIRSGKTAHSYIFEGPAGCGRKKTAFALIQAIFCSNADGDSCGACSACRKVSSGNHADIHVVEPLPDKRDISIDQLRELQHDLALRPYEAPRKVCIIEPAERMSLSAANSLLKTLEEPPGKAIIILLTENSDTLLATIRSRCQLIRFAPLSGENIKLLLEKQGMDSSTAALLAQMADGSMQRAFELDDESLAGRREILLKHLASISLGKIATIFNASEELSGNREDVLETLDMLLSIYRDIIHLAAGCGDIVNTAMRPALDSIAASLNLERALQTAGDVLDSRRAVQQNANVKLALDHLFMKMAGNNV